MSPPDEDPHTTEKAEGAPGGGVSLPFLFSLLHGQGQARSRPRPNQPIHHIRSRSGLNSELKTPGGGSKDKLDKDVDFRGFTVELEQEE